MKTDQQKAHRLTQIDQQVATWRGRLADAQAGLAIALEAKDSYTVRNK